MTKSTPSEGHGCDLPESKVQDVRDELYQLHGLTVALDHCIFACGLTQEVHTPHEAVVPLVMSLESRLDALSRQLDRHLSGIKEPQT